MTVIVKQNIGIYPKLLVLLKTNQTEITILLINLSAN